MAKAAQPDAGANSGKLKQIGLVIAYVAKRDRMFVPLAAGVTLLPLILIGVLIALGGSWFWLALGVPLALLAFMIVLNNRSNKAMLAEMEGQPGAGAQLVENMPRGGWRVTPAIASTTQFDVVSLVVGRPGVILLGEGNPARVRALLGQEKRRLSKVIGTATMHDVIVGHGDGEVPLAKLRVHLMRLPRTVSPKDVNALAVRLKALTARPAMPRGTIPKNMRPQMGGSFRPPRGR
jgi:heme exporter protein D